MPIGKDSEGREGRGCVHQALEFNDVWETACISVGQLMVLSLREICLSAKEVLVLCV